MPACERLIEVIVCVVSHLGPAHHEQHYQHLIGPSHGAGRPRMQPQTSHLGMSQGSHKAPNSGSSLAVMGWALGRGGAHCLVLKPPRGGFPGGASGKEPACQCRRCKRRGFDPWVGRIPWRRAWQPTPVFLPGESPWTEEPGGLQSTGSQGVGHDSVTEHTHARGPS